MIQGLYIQDQQGDTLLYAGEAQVRISDWFFVRKKIPVLHYISLRNGYAHLYRTPASKVWSYQFFIDAFDTGPSKDTVKKPNQFELDLKKVNIENVRFHMDDAWVGTDMDLDAGEFVLDANKLDLKKRILDVNKLQVKAGSVVMRDYKGGRPVDTSKRKSFSPIDITPFNPGKWAVSIKTLLLTDCLLSLEFGERKPVVGEFDAAHLFINKVKMNATGVTINADTVKGKINQLYAHERCGIVIRDMQSDVSVSPNASICNNLYLETNYSKIHNYFAMRYKRFPDFLSYITDVTMEARLKDAIIDSRDVAYFAPVLKRYPTTIRLSGNASGSVADIKAQQLVVTNGKTMIKGNLRMTGLPDINKTFIDFNKGEIILTGGEILRYAPSLRNSPNIALEKISYAYFNGSYKGYIENFAINGVLKTNLGEIHSDVKMNVPGFRAKTAVYSGNVSTDNFNLGTLLRQPDLGIISLKANITGTSFDPVQGQLKTNATISRFDYKGYSYRNITAIGVIARKQFNGSLEIDDPNLALAFNGFIDFNQKIVTINAKANLLKSNFYALHLTTDTVEATGDLDLNCAGSNIDNIAGTARLYNIDIKRNQHRLNLDSVYLYASEDSTGKQLTIQSNDITAHLAGNYLLSGLPYSIQYYFASYLPNYIKKPGKNAPPQNLSFSIITRNVDSLLSISAKKIRGFDNASISGILNAAEQKLSLIANIPYGSIYGYQFTGININSTGNYDLLTVNTSIDNVSVADSILSGSFTIKTTLGNDSLHFNIVTAAPEAYTSATINGDATARGDTLYMRLAPSEFYLNQTKWTIPKGNELVFSQKYLLIKNLELLSGAQKITLNTEYEPTAQNLTILTKDVDLSQFGAWGGLAAYQPDGRINGTIKINNLFKAMFVNADIKATNVKLGGDTIGNINLSGSYDGTKKLLTLNPETGIYKNSSSVTGSGNISFDAKTYQQLNGKFQFTNAPLAWLSPFLSGYVSHISGILNGNVDIGGTSQAPDITGTLNMVSAGMHIDFLGCSYTIPSGSIGITNTKIDFGNITVYDRFNNIASLTGTIQHNHFKDMKLALSISSEQFEVFNIRDFENQVFYGNLIASINPLTIRGPFNNITMNINNAVPRAKSHIYIPVTSGSSVGTYSYVSFKTYGKTQEKAKKNRNKLSINISAEMNDLAEMTLVLDPSTGDAINAKGTGTIRLEIPSNNDIRMFGRYDIDEGDYSFTFKQLFFKRKFILNAGSYISFNGPFTQTSLAVDATYTARARLYDLLSDPEKSTGIIPPNEMSDDKLSQDVNVLLHMNGSLNSPKLTFNVDIADNNRFVGTYAYTKLQRLNQDERQLFDQVASLLLVGYFIPPEGVVGSTASSGAINNFSEIISGTASSQLTNIVNKLLGNQDLAIDLKYVNYNLSDPTLGIIKGNEVSLGVKKNYFNDRLVVEVGGKSDWGRPTSASSTSNFNLAGDFRVQYLLNQAGGVRLNLFRTSDFDVTLNQSITRGGVGISWRKSFDGVSDFFHGNKYKRRMNEEKKGDSSSVISNKKVGA
ncbi:MAG: translocation/assembly module TamB domain-containing protein [Taibaiella sp.]|nr:translocation/assembly module TamB domain-containing protein [Taibaiella sp.]